MYPQEVCRIRKPACAGNGCAIFPAFEAARIEKKIRYPAADDLFRGSLERGKPKWAFQRSRRLSRQLTRKGTRSWWLVVPFSMALRRISTLLAAISSAG